MAVVFDEATKSYTDGVTTLELKDGAYEIGTVEQLKLFRDAVNEGNSFAKTTVKLTADIDLKNEEWTPIGTSTNAFQGTFDGGGNTVSNLYINQPSQSDVGFFGFTTGGEIKNLVIENADVTGYLDVGAVAGTPYTSKYTNITLTGTVKVEGYSYVGGMLGKNAYADLTGLTVDAAAGSYVKAESESYRTYVGGVVGFMGEGNITVKDVTSNINVSGSTCDVGGIAGIAHYGNTFINVTCTAQEVVLVNAEYEGDHLEVGGIAGVWHNQAGTTVQMINCKVENTELKSSLNGVEQDVSANVVTGKSYNAESGTSGSLLVGQNVTIDDATGKYTGGEFSVSGPDAVDVLNGKLADGMQAYPESDGSLVVDEAGYVAAVGDVRYKTLAEALDAAQAGGTVTLLDDVALDATLEISRNVTLELAGFTVTGNVVVQGDADVTFRGGVMTAVSGDSVIDVKGSAVLNLDGMTVDGGNALNAGSSIHAVVYESVGGLHITGSEILGGTLTHDENCGSTGSNSAAYAVYAYGSSGGSISIEDSTLKGGNGKTDATYAGSFVSQWYVDGGIALQLGGSAAVEVNNSTIHGGDSDWRDAADAINVSNTFDGTLNVSGESKVSGGNALNASGENRGIGGEGIYVNQSTGCTQIDIKDSEITGGDGGRSWNGSGIELNANIPTNIENSTITSGQGVNSNGNAGSIAISNRLPEVDVTLKDVTLNGDGNGNDVIKGATDGIKIAGDITIAGGTLEDVTFSEVETGTVIKTTGTGAVDTSSVAGTTSVPVFNEATGEYEFEFMDMTIFKVNAAWNGTAHGTEVAPGYRYGINAFDNISEAVAVNDSSEIVVVGGTFSGNQFFNGHSAVIAGTAGSEVIVDGYIFGGAYNGNTGDVSVKMTGGSAQRVYGAGSYDQPGTYTAGDIAVDIAERVVIGERVGAAKVDSGNLTTGDVTITSAGDMANLFGGAQVWYKDSSATHNSVTVNLSGKVSDTVYAAGQAMHGGWITVENGVTVNVDGGSIGGDGLMGGGFTRSDISDTDTAGGITISGGTWVNFNAGDVSAIYGGTHTYSLSGQLEAVSNITGGTHIAMTGGTVGNVQGGGYTAWGSKSVIDFTEVSISGGTVLYDVQGGSYVVGGGKDTSSGNSSTITGDATVRISGDAVIQGNVIGGGWVNWATGTASSTIGGVSTVSVEGGTVYGDVIGGGVAVAHSGDAASSVLKSESAQTVVTLTGGTVKGSVYGGGYAEDAYGKGPAVSSNAAGSSVTVDGATVEGDIYAGGFASGENTTSTVTGNVAVTISSGTIKGDIYGGGKGGTVNGDSVITISGGTFDPTRGIYGGGDSVTGNSLLNFTNTEALEVGTVTGFDSVTLGAGDVKFNAIESDEVNFGGSLSFEEVAEGGITVQKNGAEVMLAADWKNIASVKSEDVEIGSIGKNGQLTGVEQLVLQAGNEFAVTDLTIYGGSSLTITLGSTFSFAGTVELVDSGFVLNDGNSYLYGAGSFTVDLSGREEGKAYKLVTYTGAGDADFSFVTIDADTVEFNNSLYLADADRSTFYVRLDYTEENALEEGLVFGYNAFNGLNHALGEAAAGPDKIVIAAGTYDESDTLFVKGVEVASENAVFSNVWSFGVNSDTGRDFDMETAEKFTVTGDLTVGQFYAEKNANVYVKIDGNLTTVGSFGAKLATQVDVNGTVTVTPPQNGAAQVMVYGTMNVTGTLDVTTGAMGAVLLVGKESYDAEYGKGGTLNVSGADASVVLRNNTGSAIPVTVSAMSSLNVSGGATFANETGGMQNLGTVNVDNATLTLGGTLENSGTVTVSGTSVLNINALTGEITLADGATLTDSTVGGKISAEGNATVAGTTSVDQLVLEGVKGEKRELVIDADATVTVKQLDVGNGLSKPDIVPGSTDAREYFAKAQVDGTLTVDRANQAGAIYIRPYSELVVTGTLNVKGEVHNRGSLVVDGGTMNISDWETPKLLGYTTGDSLTVTNNGNMILTGVSTVTFGEAHASLQEMGVEAQYADGMFAVISAGGKFEADTLAFRNDDDATLTVTGEGSSFKLYSADGRVAAGTYNYAVNEGVIIVEDKASFDVSGLANADFVNSGSITLSSASAKFATLTNNGTVTVSGTSTLNIGSVNAASGDAHRIQIAAGTTLKDSVIGGEIRVLGDLTVDGELALGNGGIWCGYNKNALTTATVSGGMITAKYAMFQHGTYVISADMTLDYGYLSYGGTFTVNSTIRASGKSGEPFYVRGDATLADGGKLLIDKALWLDYEGAVLTVADGAAVEAGGLKLFADTSMNVNGGSVKVGDTLENNGTVTLGGTALTAGKMVNSGALVMDSSSSITTTGAFTSTGTITVTMDAAQSGNFFVQKLISASTLTVDGSLTLEGGRDGAQLVVTGNALWLDNSDKSTILINSAYAGEVGSAIAGRDGYFLGFNAQTAYDASIAADSAVEFTGGSYSFADGFAFTGHTFTVSGDTLFDKVTGGAVAVTGGTLSIDTVELTADVAALSGALLVFSGSGMADLANLVLTVSGTMANRTKYVLATGVKDDSFAITLNGETYELNVRKDGLLVGVENGELYVQKSDDWFMLSKNTVQTVLPEDGYAFGGSDMYESAVMSVERDLNVATNGQNTGARVYGGGLLRNDALFSGTQKCEVTVTSGGVGKGVIGGNRIESGSIGGTLTSSVTIDSADGTFGFIVGGNQVTGGELNGLGGTSVTLRNGTFSMWVCGGSAICGDAAAQVLGNTNVTITGGAFNCSGVFGGGFVQENGTLNQVGNTNVTIKGGTFDGNIYGGHGATNKAASPHAVLFGNTNITISGGIFNGNIYGGGFDQSKVQGDTHITFTGAAGADFSVNGIVDGDASNARYWGKGSFVTGDRYLTFDAFSGEFGATLITNIDQMEVIGGSDVNLKNQLDLSDVSQWQFDFGSSLEGFAQNDLAGDSLVLSGWEDQLGDEGWTVMSGSSITGFGEMEVTNGSDLIFAWNADEQYYLGSIGDEQFKLSMEDGAMKLAKLA